MNYTPRRVFKTGNCGDEVVWFIILHRNMLADKEVQRLFNIVSTWMNNQN